jgi:hypothetical protein
MGLASGPFAAAWLLDVADYALLVNVSAAVLALSLPAMFVPARVVDGAGETKRGPSPRTPQRRRP